MKRQKKQTTEELREAILKRLLEINRKPIVPLTVSALKSLKMKELMDITYIITHPTENSRQNSRRPKCPVIDPRYQTMPTYNFKKRMAKYLEEEYGFQLEYPATHVLSLYEWLANAFEEARNGNGKRY